MRKLLPALAAVLACAACAVPVFDPSMSAAVAAFRNSHVVGSSYATIGPDMEPNSQPDFDLERDALVFMPVRLAGTIDWTRGFVIRREEYDSWNQIWYQWWDGSKVKWLNSPASYYEEEGLRWVWPVTIKNGSSLGAIIFDSGDFETWLDRLFADTPTENCSFVPPHPWQNMSDRIKTDLGLVPMPVVVGISVNARDLPGQDQLQVLFRDGLNFSEAETLVSDSGFAPLGAPPNFSYSVTPCSYPLPFLGTPRHINYARDRDPAKTRSFAQWMDSDGWNTGAWFGNIGTTATEIDEVVNIPHRIDTVLTTKPEWLWDVGSYLLSTEKQIARVYLYNGIGTEKQVAEFGLGTLRFIGEMYLNGEWQLLFSRAVINDQTDPPTVRFEIRGIYTKDLLAAFGL